MTLPKAHMTLMLLYAKSVILLQAAQLSAYGAATTVYFLVILVITIPRAHNQVLKKQKQNQENDCAFGLVFWSHDQRLQDSHRA